VLVGRTATLADNVRVLEENAAALAVSVVVVDSRLRRLVGKALDRVLFKAQVA
jgi:hypothetical protein